jgi:WYL_2, Sm-like SH3 beta-barrel fold
MKMTENEKDVHTFATKEGKKWLKSVLNTNIVTITFTKNDGTERVMNCTLDTKIVPQVIHETNTDNPIDFPKTKKVRAISDDVLPVYDVEAQGWRSFRWDSVTKLEFKL